MTTDHLDRTTLTVGQNGKETTVNNSDGRLENATQREFEVDMTAGDVTLTETNQASNYSFKATGLTANRKLIFNTKYGTNPANSAARYVRVENNSGSFTVEVEQDNTGQTIIVLPKTAVALYMDGTNVKRVDSGMALGGFAAGIPAANALLFQYVATESFELAIGLPGTQSFLGVATTLAVSYVIQKNGANIGTIDFAALGTVGTYTFVAAVSFVAGDRLQVLAPAVPDATAADLSFTYSARRT